MRRIAVGVRAFVVLAASGCGALWGFEDLSRDVDGGEPSIDAATNGEGDDARSRDAGIEGPLQSGVAVFEFTAAAQTFKVPSGVFRVSITAAGAAGSTDCYNASREGALGAVVTATVVVTPEETLSIFVGGAGGKPGGTSGCPNGGTGGFNGGAPGGASGPAQNFAGGGGGGASDVRRGGNALANRIVVAAGGGGSGGLGGLGGAGGVLTGEDGRPGYDDSLGGGGGTQSAGGAGGRRASYASSDGQPGSLGVGGTGAPHNDSGGGGGGGGFYGGGGGGGAYGSAGGGGGSSYVQPGASNVGMLQAGARTGNGRVTIRY